MSLAEAEELAISVLKQVMEEKITSTNVEIAVIPTATRQFKVYSPSQLDEIISRLPQEA